MCYSDSWYNAPHLFGVSFMFTRRFMFGENTGPTACYRHPARRRFSVLPRAACARTYLVYITRRFSSLQQSTSTATVAQEPAPQEPPPPGNRWSRYIPGGLLSITSRINTTTISPNVHSLGRRRREELSRCWHSICPDGAPPNAPSSEEKGIRSGCGHHLPPAWRNTEERPSRLGSPAAAKVQNRLQTRERAQNTRHVIPRPFAPGSCSLGLSRDALFSVQNAEVEVHTITGPYLVAIRTHDTRENLFTRYCFFCKCLVLVIVSPRRIYLIHDTIYSSSRVQKKVC